MVVILNVTFALLILVHSEWSCARTSVIWSWWLLPATTRARDFCTSWSLSRFTSDMLESSWTSTMAHVAYNWAGIHVHDINRHHSTDITESMDVVVTLFAGSANGLIKRETGVECTPRLLMWSKGAIGVLRLRQKSGYVAIGLCHATHANNN